MRRALLLFTLLTALLPGVAHGWYVDISITGAGRVYETTDANELDEHCTASAGYRFAGWQSDGRTNPGPVLCERVRRVVELRRHGLPVRHVPEPADPRALRGRQVA